MSIRNNHQAAQNDHIEKPTILSYKHTRHTLILFRNVYTYEYNHIDFVNKTTFYNTNTILYFGNTTHYRMPEDPYQAKTSHSIIQ